MYAFWERWNNRGLPQELIRRLRELLRAHQGRAAEPSACIADSRSSRPTTPSPRPPAATTEARNSGSGRHLAVDAEGWLLALVVTAASVSDKAGAKLLIIRLFNAFSTLKIMWADNGYDGAPLARYAKAAAAITVEVVKRTAPHSFQVLRRRWVIERTFGWLMRYGAWSRLRTPHRPRRSHDLLGHRHHHPQAPRPLRNRNAGRAALGRRTRASRPARAGGAANMNSFIYRLSAKEPGAP